MGGYGCINGYVFVIDVRARHGGNEIVRLSMSGVEVRLTKMRGGALVPADQDSEERLTKVKMGDTHSYKIKKIRCYKFHKKYFGMIKLVYENQEKYKNQNAMRYALQMQAGYFEPITTLKGEVVYIPTKIDFDSMDEVEFGELYNGVLNGILKYMMVGSTQEEIERVLQFG